MMRYFKYKADNCVELNQSCSEEKKKNPHKFDSLFIKCKLIILYIYIPANYLRMKKKIYSVERRKIKGRFN